jgi:hypothetical protein
MLLQTRALDLPCALEVIDAMQIVLDKPTPFMACEREITMLVGAFSGSDRLIWCARGTRTVPASIGKSRVTIDVLRCMEARRAARRVDV